MASEGKSVVDDRRFHNLFHYFRGQSASGETYDQQLENNATKALVNVLEHSHREVAESFIARFVRIEIVNGWREFGIEGGPVALAPGTRSFLLAIASDPAIPSPPPGYTPDGGKGRIDAEVPSEAVGTPAQERAACSQRILDCPRYWSAAEQVLGFPSRREGSICPIASAYQPVRNIAAARALANGRSAVFGLLFDERNPYFGTCDAWPGWPAALESAVLPEADVAFRYCSWQKFLGSGAVPDDVVAWAEEKHGLVPSAEEHHG